MREPNFFIIGAPKCGTTSLAHWLSEHPKIYISPIKEPHFYCSDIGVNTVNTFEEYQRMFRKAGEEHIAVGEATTSYLFSEVAVPEIENKYPDPLYIVMVRNLVDMAYSFHGEMIFKGNEHIRDFKKAWELSPQRREQREVTRYCREPKLLDYQSVCSLGTQIERLFQIVPRERVLIVFLEEIKENPEQEYKKVLEFLGVPDDGREVFPVKNPAKVRRWYGVNRMVYWLSCWARAGKKFLGIPYNKGTGMLKRIEKMNYRKQKRPELPDELREELIKFFKPEIEKLTELTGRDLSHWTG